MRGTSSVRGFSSVRPISFVVVTLGLALVFAGCSSIQRQSVFTACSDGQCLRCKGTGSYRCEQCLGRGNVPCRVCKGLGTVTCMNCGGDGIVRGQKCGCALGLGPVGRQTCPGCSGTRTENCPTCRGKGMVACGKTEYHWVCRKCGAKFDYPAEQCPGCGAK